MSQREVVLVLRRMHLVSNWVKLQSLLWHSNLTLLISKCESCKTEAPISLFSLRHRSKYNSFSHNICKLVHFVFLLSRGVVAFLFSCHGLSGITLHVSFIETRHHLRLRRSCISFLLFILHSMQTPTAFKTLNRLSAQLMRNRESLLLPHTAAAICAHRAEAWNTAKMLRSMNRDMDARCHQSVSMCSSLYKKMHPAAVAATRKAVPSSLSGLLLSNPFSRSNLPTRTRTLPWIAGNPVQFMNLIGNLIHVYVHV